ncbi:hypothetical protein VCRA217O317_100047 [Vibrio crassostreae]|nr:hypothetical protein VCRA217O317_100047 [Vibrio crassostreae]
MEVDCSVVETRFLNQGRRVTDSMVNFIFPFIILIYDRMQS